MFLHFRKAFFFFQIDTNLPTNRPNKRPMLTPRTKTNPQQSQTFAIWKPWEYVGVNM